MPVFLKNITIGFCSIVICLALVIQGCASRKPYSAPVLAGEDGTCLSWLEKIDTAVDRYDLKDPGTARITGFPHLRLNRFLASMSDRATAGNAFAEWLEQMRRLDQEARMTEFANLPAAEIKPLVAGLPAGASFEQSLRHCGRRLSQYTLNTPEHRRLLLERAKVPDSYQTWKRYAGAYLLAQYPAAMAIERLHRKLNASFQKPPEQLPVQGRLVRYRPPPGDALNAEAIAAILRRAYANPLAIPALNASELRRLFHQFAPVWEIDTRNDTDQIGAVMLNRNGRPYIDIRQSAVYVGHAYTRLRGKVLLQLIYQIWLPERERTGLLDLYGGPLDSVIWRVTLNPEGTPVAFDSIHGCGCYYLLFPGQGYRAIPPKDGAEPALSPKAIANPAPGQRLLLRLQSRTHYLQQAAIVNDDDHVAARQTIWRASEQLRSLPLPDSARRSLFGKDGIVDASERAERFLLWPFGVASPGAMRQWGTHAIAFTGRRHFDDPFLLEKLLEQQ